MVLDGFGGGLWWFPVVSMLVQGVGLGAELLELGRMVGFEVSADGGAWLIWEELRLCVAGSSGVGYIAGGGASGLMVVWTVMVRWLFWWW